MLALLLACGRPEPAPPAPAPPPPAEEPVVASIGGEPILPRPVVLGGIATEGVVATVEARAADLRRCYDARLAADPTLRGKVLVKIVLAADGGVTSATVRSTSLRDPATEACLLEVVSGLRFPPLATGATAIVQYPFAFP